MPDDTPGGMTSASPAPPPPAGGVPPGPTGPATMAPVASGRNQQALIQANIGLSMLERAAGLFGGTASDDGREILSAVLKLRKRFGASAPDLNRQEVKMLGEKVAPVQQPTPQQGQQWQAAIKARQAQQGLPGVAA
jgi:hypothetical protein